MRVPAHPKDPDETSVLDATGLGRGLRQGLEELSGLDLGHVRVHRNSTLPSSLQASAVAQGNRIHLAPGAESHLPHEGWHVVQQLQGRVPRTSSVGGTPINDDPRLEREADVYGTRAAHLGSRARQPAAQRQEAAPPVAVAQRQRIPLVGNVVTDAVAGAGTGLVSAASWAMGEVPAGLHARILHASPALSHGGFATGMQAVLRGYPIPGGAAPGAITNPAWAALKRKKTRTGGAFYVRLHLLRDKFGGPAVWSNLVPFTNRGNNPSALSHLHTVEVSIQAALQSGMVVGYHVVPIYGGLPGLSLPRTIVNFLLGWVARPWLRDLADILYYENMVPTALWTSWWDHRSWLPIPSIRVIRNWVHWDEQFRFDIKPDGMGRRALTWPECVVLGCAEIAKLVIGGALPAGVWQRVASIGSMAGISWIPGAKDAAEFLSKLPEHYSSLAMMVGNVGADVLLYQPRDQVAGALGGFVPSAGEGLGLAAAAASRWRGARG
ncbi:MAG: DUF4157 domain-containing protein [Planctomycetota bacterium]